MALNCTSPLSILPCALGSLVSHREVLLWTRAGRSFLPVPMVTHLLFPELLVKTLIFSSNMWLQCSFQRCVSSEISSNAPTCQAVPESVCVMPVLGIVLL